MLKKHLLIASVFCLLLSLTGFAQFKQSEPKSKTSKTTRVDSGGGIDMTGEIDGAPYRIVKPASWNGKLIIYGHGYRDKAQPGEPNNRTPDVAPDPALEPVLLGLGYAIAGSAFKDNGWAVEEGYVDSKNLVAFFKTNVAMPTRVLYWGFSMGSVIGFMNAETTTVYDGVMCGCAVGAGAPSSFDASADLLVGYNTVFGMPMPWGTPGDVRDNLDFETEVFPKIFAELNNAANFPGFEFIRLVIGTPGRGINPPPPPDFYPAWVATDMFFATEVRAELEVRANGAVVQNLNRNYNLTTQERTYLNTLGLTNTQIDTWLLAMNNQRVYNAPPASRNYLIANRKYTGRALVPVLTMHTIIDPLVTVTQENAYATINANAGRPSIFTRIRNSPSGGANPREFLTHADLLYQTYTDANGHCNFTGDQLITAITTLDNWVATKTRPTAANFPEAAGFNNSFMPPPLNQP